MHKNEVIRAPENQITHVAREKWLRLVSLPVLLVVAMAVDGMLGGAPAQSSYTTIKSFGFGDQAASWPNGIIEGSDGMLYGTAAYGGSNNLGIVYKVNKNGTGFLILKSFSDAPGDGQRPFARLVQGSDGLLYGTTWLGGTNIPPGTSRYQTNLTGGTVFRLNVTGSTFEILHRFNGANGARPGALIEGADGFLYGSTRGGGISNAGTIFRLNKAGSVVVLKHFVDSDGVEPGYLAQDTNGFLYGTTWIGGSSNLGTIFKLGTDGGNFSVLKSFAGSDGAWPPDPSIVVGNGTLFGITAGGGTLDGGTLFRLNQDGSEYAVMRNLTGNSAGPRSLTLISNRLFGVASGKGAGYGTFESVFRVNQDGSDFRELKLFSETNDGRLLNGPLWSASDGFIYGTTLKHRRAEGGTIFRLRDDGSDYTITKSFNAGGYDGIDPRGTLIRGNDGMLYGTTFSGGSNHFGTVFKIHPSGTGYTILKSFTEPEGINPSLALLQTRDGVLFGTTVRGGGEDNGIVFRLNTDGTGFAVVKVFAAADGGPSAGLVQANDGMLYGATQGGPIPGAGGVIFRLNSHGSNYTVLRRLQDYCSEGLIQGLDNALYGTTVFGGTHGKGTVFKIDLTGGNYIVLRSFTGTNEDGRYPRGLMQTSAGVLYGCTEQGGIGEFNANGTLFRMNPDGSGYQVLRRFTESDGRWPSGSLVQRADGLLYGTTGGGGAAGQGTVFQLNPDGSGYAVLHAFIDGGGRNLLLTSDGKLFGPTRGGGTMRSGSLFSLEPAPAMLPPVISSQGVRVRLTGIADRSYMVQRATSTKGPWITITTVTADSAGTVSCDDDSAPGEACFYRAIQP